MAITYTTNPEPLVNDGAVLPAQVDRQRLWWALALGVAGLVTGVLWATGVSAFPLVVVALVAGGFALSQFSTLRFGFLGALAVLLGGYAILLQFTNLIPWGLAAIGGVALLALIVSGMAALLRTANPILPTRRGAIWGAVLFALSVLASAVFIPLRNARGVSPVWAMHNDAVVQMIKARVQLNFDGFDTTTALNSSPLTSALVALPAAAGRIGITDPNRYLENDVLRLAELWVLLVLATSALAGWIAWRMARSATTRSRVLPVIAAVLAALMPFTWYFAGFSFAFGFLNSTLSLVILLLAWALWLELPGNPPNLVAGGLSLATVAMLATWAPVALVPAGLAILALWKGLRENLAAPDRAGWIGWVLAALPVPLYGLFVTLPDFNEQGEALAVAGGIGILPPVHVAMVTVFVIVGLVAYALVNRSYRMLGALAAVLLTSAFLVTFLAHLNTRVGVPAWGYYPIKAAWAITSLLLIIGVAAMFGALIRSRLPIIGQGAGMVLVSVLTVVLMRQYAWEPITIENAFAPLQILRSESFASGPWRGNILFDAYRDDELTIMVLEETRWMAQDLVVPGDGRADRFANFWLLQVHPGAGLPGGPEEDMRRFAYTLDPRYPTDICAAIEMWNREWGRSATVLTVDPNLEAELQGICPTANFAVEISAPVWPRPAQS